MTKLQSEELYYALAILRMLFKGRKSSFKKEELNNHPDIIVEWLKEKELLVDAALYAENRQIEERVVLGMRALNFLELGGMGYQAKMLGDINEG